MYYTLNLIVYYTQPIVYYIHNYTTNSVLHTLNPIVYYTKSAPNSTTVLYNIRLCTKHHYLVLALAGALYRTVLHLLLPYTALYRTCCCAVLCRSYTLIP